MPKMKLKTVDFARRNLLRIIVNLEVPYSSSLDRFLERYSFKSPKDCQIFTKSKRKPELFRFVISISRENKESITDLHELLNAIPKSSFDSVVPVFQIWFSYSTDRYETDPVLPIEYPLRSVEKDAVSLTGVKLSFDGKESGLLYSIIDLQYCISCGKYDSIMNLVVMRENIPLNSSFLTEAVKRASEYSKAFIKRKGT